MTIGMTVDAEALPHEHAAATTTTTLASSGVPGGDIQAYVTPAQTQPSLVINRDGYSTATLVDLAGTAGITNYSTAVFTNNPDCAVQWPYAVGVPSDAAPVLANIEKAIERLALTGHATPAEVDSEVGQIRQQVEDIKSEPVNNDDIGEPADGGRIKEPPTLVGDTTPSDLEQVLTTNGLTRGAFEPDRTRPGVYCLKLPAEKLSALSFSKDGGVHDIEEYFDPSPVAPLPVTFNRATWDESDDPALVFLTYGTPELAALLPATDSDAEVLPTLSTMPSS